MALCYFCIICSRSRIAHIGKYVEVAQENGIGCQMSHHLAHKYINKLGKEGISQKKWILCEQWCHKNQTTESDYVTT